MSLFESTRRLLRLARTCDIKRVPAGGNPAARETVVTNLACSDVYPASPEQAERAGMALAARLMVVYTAPGSMMTDWRLATGNTEYRIRAISAWPISAPKYYEVLIEQE